MMKAQQETEAFCPAVRTETARCAHMSAQLCSFFHCKIDVSPQVKPQSAQRQLVVAYTDQQLLILLKTELRVQWKQENTKSLTASVKGVFWGPVRP